MVFKNRVKNIQTAGYNGSRTVSITLFHICELAILRSCFDYYSRTKYFFLEMSTHFLFTVAVKETCHDLLFLHLYNSGGNCQI